MTHVLIVENEDIYHWLEMNQPVSDIVSSLNASGPAPLWLPNSSGGVGRQPMQWLILGSLLILFPRIMKFSCLADQSLAPPLTPRQQQVLQALVIGLSTRQIAARLHLTERTILMHIHALKQRFQVENREQVILQAAQLGIIQIQKPDP